jgi:hypothetical protein
MHGRGLARTPDETHHREALAGIGMQQVLAVALGAGQGAVLGQPVVMAHQLAKQGGAALQQLSFGRVFVDQGGEVMQEQAQAVEPRDHGELHGDGGWTMIAIKASSGPSALDRLVLY